MTTEPLRIEGLPDLPPVLLAPMSGVSDLPCRRMVRRFFDGLIYSEMIAGKEMLRGTAQSRRMAMFDEDEMLPAVQIAGREPALMADAARLAVDQGAVLVDINFGCPAKKVVNGLGGAALLKDEPLAARILEAVVRSVDVPVTVKMRLGWDASSVNAPTVARIAEAAGIRMITVHGRTREQMYDGRSDWSAVGAVRAQVAVPVVVNGDIGDGRAATAALRQSGADAVMIGRAVCGRPWLPGLVADHLACGCHRPEPSPEIVARVALQHYDDILGFYGTARGVRIARKHLAWYLQSWPHAPELMRRLVLLEHPGEVRAAIRDFVEGLTSRRARAA